MLDVAGRELGAAKNIASANDDRQLHAALRRLVDLLRDGHDFVHADAALAGVGKTLAGELQHDTAVAGAVFRRVAFGHSAATPSPPRRIRQRRFRYLPNSQ